MTPFPELTPSERRIALLLVEDKPRSAIATELGWTRNSVSTATHRLLAKVRVRGVAGLTRLAIRREYIEP